MADDSNDGVMNEIEKIFGSEVAGKFKEIGEAGAGDGVLTGKDKNYQSVIQKLATAITQADLDGKYKQQLLLSTFMSRDDASLVVAAIDERKRYGVDLNPIVDLIIAWAAVKGASGGRIESIVESLTHQSISTNMNANARKFISDKFGGRKDSPIS